MLRDDLYLDTALLPGTIHNINARISTEKIFILGISHQQQVINTIFNTRPIETSKQTGLDLLILHCDKDAKRDDVFQNIVEKECASGTAITAFVMPFQRFNEWLMAGNSFARKVVDSAILCFDAKHVQFAVPTNSSTTNKNNGSGEVFGKKISTAAEFICGSELYIIRNQLPLAAFHLHQVAEQIYTGLIYFVTGLSIETHNLDKLYRYSRYLVKGIAEIFPRDSDHEKFLFRILQKAYIESRYGTEFKVKRTDIEELRQRILKLMDVAVALKRERTVDFVV